MSVCMFRFTKPVNRPALIHWRREKTPKIPPFQRNPRGLGPACKAGALDQLS